MKEVALILMMFLFSTTAFAKASEVQGFCRGGQTFLTWQETPGAKQYIVSRVEGSNIREQAKVAQGSGIDALAIRWAQKQNRKEAPSGYIIRPGGSPLPEGTGIWVHTVAKPGRTTYRVATAEGNEIGQVSIDERPGKPEPVLIGLKKVGENRVIRTYIHWATPEMGPIDGQPFKFVVQTDSAFGSEKLPLSMVLHGWGGGCGPTGWTGEKSIALMPDDYTPGLAYDEYDWWYGCSDNFTDLHHSTIQNYTERRLLYTLHWVMAHFPVDENRVYLRGSSMGGTAAIRLGFRHPELFAAIDANVPMVNPGMDGIGPIQTGLEKNWGARDWKLKTREGENVWDYHNMTRFAAMHHEDLPFLKTISGRGDRTLIWDQIPPFLRALQQSKHGVAAFWGTEAHVYNHEKGKVPDEFFRFQIERFRKNESYPAISNLSANGNLGGGNPAEGDAISFMNTGFDWQVLSDTPSRWKIKLIPVDASVKSSSLDLTPRRLQKLKVESGKSYRFRNVDAKTGKLLQEGTIRPDAQGLLTIEKLQISAEGNLVVIERS